MISVVVTALFAVDLGALIVVGRYLNQLAKNILKA